MSHACVRMGDTLCRTVPCGSRRSPPSVPASRLALLPLAPASARELPVAAALMASLASQRPWTALAG
ncbi:unnamed protein product [Symbiodinium sp. CCMP2592]|nr:unnamed protein product [Symbiodinium sp. CCMP2592]